MAGGACGLLVIALLTWALPVSTAQEEANRGWRGLPKRVAALEQKLRYLTVMSAEDAPPKMVITGANLRIVNGPGSTDCTDEEGNSIPDCPNGLGNLIVAYNESREADNIRAGSHNVVVGQGHNFSRFGGLVVGTLNTISGDFAVVSRGRSNSAGGDFAAEYKGMAHSLVLPQVHLS